MKKLQNKKVIYSNDRIICNEKGVAFAIVFAATQTYIGMVNYLKNIPSINFDQNKFNDSINFKLLDMN